MPRVKKDTTIDNDLNIDKDKIIKNLTKEIKENLENEISDIVDNIARNKLDNMANKIYKYKNRTIRKKNIIIIILLLIIILETKLLFDGTNVKDYIKTTTNNISVKEEKGLDWYIDKYGYLLDMVKTNLDTDNYTYLYQNSYNTTDIDNKVKLNIAYSILDDKKINNTNSVLSIKEDDLKDSYTKIFGTNNEYKAENFNVNCINYIYNKNNKSYMAIDVECSNNMNIKENIINIEENENNIIIETILGLIDDDKNLKTIQGTIIKENFNNEDLSQYQDNLNKYKYTFSKENNNYYFKSIEKIK